MRPLSRFSSAPAALATITNRRGAATLQFASRTMPLQSASPSDAILNLAFVDQSGKEIRPRDLIGSQHLVLVFVRGFNGAVCPYCLAYTSGLISNFAAISQHGANVLLVYPIAKPDQKQRLEEFLRGTFEKSASPAGKVPFPVVLDIGLKGVDALGIRQDLPNRQPIFLIRRATSLRTSAIRSPIGRRSRRS